MLDPFYIKTFQRLYYYTFTQEELEDARSNNGNISIQLDGAPYHLTIPTFLFPRDLTSIAASDYSPTPSQPWEFFGE